MAEEFKLDPKIDVEPDTIVPTSLSEDIGTFRANDKTKEMIPDPTVYVEEMIKERGYPRSFQVCVNAMRSALREMSVDSISISQPEQKSEWIEIINRLTAVFTKNFRTFYAENLASKNVPENNTQMSVDLDELFAFFPNNIVKATAAISLQNALDSLLKDESNAVRFWVDFTKESISKLQHADNNVTDVEEVKYHYSLVFSFLNVREKWFHYYEQDFFAEDRANMSASTAKTQQTNE